MDEIIEHLINIKVAPRTSNVHGGWIDTTSAVQLMDEIIEHLQSINAGPPAPPISMLENIDTASA